MDLNRKNYVILSKIRVGLISGVIGWIWNRGQVRVIHHVETCRIMTQTVTERSCTTLHWSPGGHRRAPQVSLGNADLLNLTFIIPGPTALPNKNVLKK